MESNFVNYLFLEDGAEDRASSEANGRFFRALRRSLKGSKGSDRAAHHG